MKNKLLSPCRWPAATVCLILICGCASTPQMYQWGDYQRQVYHRFAANSESQEQIEAMERTLKINKENKPMPPGFHAHLGLLYGETGRFDEMREQFTTEKELFPESAGFMDFLLSSEKTSLELSQEVERMGGKS